MYSVWNPPKTRTIGRYVMLKCLHPENGENGKPPAPTDRSDVETRVTEVIRDLFKLSDKSELLQYHDTRS